MLWLSRFFSGNWVTVRSYCNIVMVTMKTGMLHRSGRLVFTEGDSDDEIVATPPGKGGYTHLNLGQGDYHDDNDDMRDRSQSTGSEQIGRFEVSTTVCSHTSTPYRNKEQNC